MAKSVVLAKHHEDTEVNSCEEISTDKAWLASARLPITVEKTEVVLALKLETISSLQGQPSNTWE